MLRGDEDPVLASRFKDCALTHNFGVTADPEGKEVRGLCSNYLADVQAGQVTVFLCFALCPFPSYKDQLCSQYRLCKSTGSAIAAQYRLSTGSAKVQALQKQLSTGSAAQYRLSTDSAAQYRLSTGSAKVPLYAT